MILKGSQRGGGIQLARHLLNLRDNDHVELHELRGFVSDDLMGAFKETQAISLGTKCAQFLFSLSLSPPELENVPVSAFENAIETIEKKIGLTGQPRAIVFHEKAGRRHAHCVWSRIDAERMRAINLPHFKLKLQDISRELYVEHQWQMPPGLQDKTKTDQRNYTQADAGQAKRVRTDPKHLKALFQTCWESSDCKTAFAYALKEHGLILAKGDRRGFVAVDAQGEVYSISRWVGIKAKEVRARLGTPDDLPTVEQAKALITANLSDTVTASREETTKLYDAQLHKLEVKRHELIKQQRQARETLKQAQQTRLKAQATQGANRLPTGLTATWSKLIGQYQKILDENAILRQEAIKRAEAERQQLIQLQLKERQGLQQEIRQFKLQHEIATKSLSKKTGNSLRHLHVDPDQPLVIPLDEDALTLAEKVRHDPETILKIISDKKETFTRNDILRRLSDYIEDPADYQMAIQQVFQSKQLVQVESDPSPRYTTRELQTVKASLERHTQAMNKTHHHGVKAGYARSAIEQQNTELQKTVGASLSHEQQDAIEHVLKGNQLSTVIGYAGAGKSTMLSAAKQAWEQQGYRVIGAALSGKAADGLEISSGIESRTLASFEQSWKNDYHTLQANDVLVIDEAGMVGTRQMARFVEHVKKAGAKLVLVGDPEQLQPIQAGTPFKEITEKLETTTLTEIRRQKVEWQRQASIDLAKGNIQKALLAYEEKGCVKVSEETDDAISHLVEDYMADMALHGTDLSRLALAHRRKDVHKINQAIRSVRKINGELNEEVVLNTKHGPRAFAKDDRLLFTQNDRELGVRNGMLGTVESVTEDQITVCLDSDGGNQMKKVTINPNQYDAFDHGYATTIHKSQGATVDKAYVLASSTMDKYLTYVAMTRHKKEVSFYTNEKALRIMSLLESDNTKYVEISYQRCSKLNRW